MAKHVIRSVQLGVTDHTDELQLQLQIVNLPSLASIQDELLERKANIDRGIESDNPQTYELSHIKESLTLVMRGQASYLKDIIKCCTEAKWMSNKMSTKLLRDIDSTTSNKPNLNSPSSIVPSRR